MSAMMSGMISEYLLSDFFLKSTNADSLRINSREPLRSPCNDDKCHLSASLLGDSFLYVYVTITFMHLHHVAHSILEVQLVEDLEQ